MKNTLKILRYSFHICKIGKVDIFSINLQFFNIEPNHNMWHPPKSMKLNNIYEKCANED